MLAASVVAILVVIVTPLLLYLLGFRLVRVEPSPAEEPARTAGAWERVVRRQRLLTTRRRLFGLLGKYLGTVPRSRSLRRRRQGTNWNTLGRFLDEVRENGWD